jgi:hypothetical protein
MRVRVGIGALLVAVAGLAGCTATAAAPAAARCGAPVAGAPAKPTWSRPNSTPSGSRSSNGCLAGKPVGWWSGPRVGAGPP